VACNYDGHVIGDGILIREGENLYNLIGRPSMHNWVQYIAKTGKYDVRMDRDERSTPGTANAVRKAYRFQIQGPNAMKLIEKLTGKPAPTVKFFHGCIMSIAGKQVHALRHGMAGQPGFEVYGPWADGETVRQAFIEGGKEFGLRLVGARAYSSNTLESGWIPSPIPAIYSGDKLKEYRESLPADGYEAKASMGGSFASKKIEDYYFTPYDLGYGSMVKFDHDFVGREALEKISQNPTRQKVTLVLNEQDVTRAIGTIFQKEGRAKFFEFPSAVYATLPYDKVLKNGKHIGVSTWVGYSSNEGKMLTLAVLDKEQATIGNEVTFVWGEENGGTQKPTVERHVQTEIRATVAPLPYSEVARQQYRK
jgi:syringate O-demethylase